MNDPLPDEARSETIRHGARLDLRLVPAALTCWVVTAAGILRPVGAVLAIVCVVAAGAVLAARHRIPGYADGLGAGLLAVCVVGAGFGFAITLRSDNVRDHPVAQRFGTVDGGDRHRHGKPTVGGQRESDVPGESEPARDG